MSKVAAGKAITEPTQDNACLAKRPRYSDCLPVPARLEVISVTKDVVAVRTIESRLESPSSIRLTGAFKDIGAGFDFCT